MKKLHLALFFTLAVLSASSQKVYFIYIQTETPQQFFVNLNKKTSWSANSGYLILSNLHDSTYSFTVGFPQNKWPEQKFSVAVNKKDHGYLLKNSSERGWGLYDLVTNEVIMSGNSTATIEPGNSGNVSPFTEILAKATDDPSLKENTPKPVKEAKEETVITEPVKDTAIAVKPVDTPVTQEMATTNDPAGKKNKKKKQKDSELVNTDKPSDKNLENKVETKSDGVIETKTVDNKPVDTQTAETKPDLKADNKESNTPPEDKKEAKSEVKNDPAQVPEVVSDNKKSKSDKKSSTSVEDKKDKPEIKESIAVIEQKNENPAGNKEVGTVTEEIKKGKQDPVTEINNPANQTDQKDTNDKKYQASKVNKYAENTTTDGVGVVFIDSYSNGVKDTIRMVIPNPKPVVDPVKEEPKEEKKFLDINSQPGTERNVPSNKAEIVTKKDEPEIKKEEAKTKEEDKSNSEALKVKKDEEVITQPDVKSTGKGKQVNTANPGLKTECPQLASEDEFVKLRKRMAGEKEDKMLGEAKKYFKVRCFSTNQVQVLGRLFETDEERYKWDPLESTCRHASLSIL